MISFIHVMRPAKVKRFSTLGLFFSHSSVIGRIKKKCPKEIESIRL